MGQDHGGRTSDTTWCTTRHELDLAMAVICLVDHIPRLLGFSAESNSNHLGGGLICCFSKCPLMFCGHMLSMGSGCSPMWHDVLNVHVL